MALEYRVLGPPGTGKTSWVARQIQHALYKYHAEDIYALSFTRAAAAELAGRETGLPRGNVGTIHSLCYAYQERQAIMEADKDLLKEWNEKFGSTWPVKTDARRLDESHDEEDGLLAWNRHRGMLLDGFGGSGFAESWEHFKCEHDAIDFTDMLLRAPAGIPARVLLVDEAQDMTPLQWRIIRRWGEAAEVFILVGDEDQTIYEWMGATPAHMLEPLPAEQIKTLRQSYRLPRAVHAYANEWIHRLGDRRAEKAFEPRGVDGHCSVEEFALDAPDDLIDDLMEHEGTGMVLASCAYMLRPLIQALRERGIAYHNPFRKERGDWNPLAKGGMARRLGAFLWCGEALRDGNYDAISATDPWRDWMFLIKSAGALHPGAKAAVAAHKARVGLAEINAWLPSAALIALTRGDTGWLADHLTAQAAEAAEFPLAVLKQGGESALTQPPRVIVGTIHSVKGGEADQVYLSPDLSWAAERGADTEEGQDALVRLMYVGMTRARERLVLCQPSGKHSVTW